MLQQLVLRRPDMVMPFEEIVAGIVTNLRVATDRE